jgi:membrane protease YdiL (CAAX protease family)
MLLSTLARGFGVVGGAVGSSAVFALVHQELILMPGLFVLSLLLSWLTVRTARIGPAILAHMAFNATTVVELLVFQA